MADFYFFTDVDAIDIQSQSQAFGSINNNQFRVSNLFSASTISNPRAFLICDGQIAALPNASNPNQLIDVILRPTVKLSNKLGGQHVDIKYIIYKGIQKSSLINGSEIAQRTSNQLTQIIWTNQDLINENIGINNTPSASILRYDSDVNEDVLLDKIFYGDQNEYTFEVINGGIYIGDFTPNQFGVVIVLDEIRSRPKTNLSNDTEVVIDVTEILDPYEVRIKKEEVLRYMDLTSLYGAFFNSQILYKQSSDNLEMSENKPLGFRKDAKGLEIYNILLQKFYNKNRVYIDIRNELNLSFNFYNNYSNLIKIKQGINSTESEIDYYNQNNGWPLLILDYKNNEGDTLYFPSIVSTKQIQIGFKLPYVASVNSRPHVFFSQGIPYSNRDRSFPEYPVHRDCFIDIGRVNNSDPNYTAEVKIAVPSVSINNLTPPISQLVRIKYLKNSFVNDAISSYPNQNNKFDCVFQPYLMNNKFSDIIGSTDAMLEIRSWKEDSYIPLGVPDSIFSQNNSLVRKNFVANIGVGKDKNNTVFFAFLTQRNSDYSNQTPLNIVDSFSTANDVLAQVSKSNNNFNDGVLNNQIFKGELQLSVNPAVNTPYLRFIQTTSNRLRGSFQFPSQQSNIDNELVAVVIKNTTITELFLANDLDSTKDVFLKFNFQSNSLDINQTSYSSWQLSLKGYKKVNDVWEFIEWVPQNPIILYGYNENGTKGNQPYILVEKDAEIDVSDFQSELNDDCIFSPNDPIGSNTITDQNFINHFYDFYQRLVVANSGHLPSKNLLENLFNLPDNQIDPNLIRVWLANDIKCVELPEDMGMLPKGYLAEMCTLFVIWRLNKLMRGDITQPSNFISGPYWNNYKNILIANGFIEPFDSNSISKVNWERLLSEIIIGIDNKRGKLPIGSKFYLGNEISRKKILFRRMFQGKPGFDSFNRDEQNVNLFVFPGGTPNIGMNEQGDFRTNKLMINILNDINNETVRIINKESNCLFRFFTGNNVVPDSAILAVGNGSGTKGLFNLDDEAIQLFFYNFNLQQINNNNRFLLETSLVNSKLFNLPLNEVNSTIVHLSLFGIDSSNNNNSGRIIDVSVLNNKGNYKYICRFQTTDLAGVPLPIDSYDTSTLQGTTVTQPSQYIYIFSDVNNRPVAFYNSDLKDLRFVKLNPGDKINVDLRTGGDEISLLVNITPTSSKIESLHLIYNDLFADDVYELSNSQAESIIDTSEKFLVIDKIAELINDGYTSSSFQIELLPGFIGKLNPESEFGIERDSDYWFDPFTGPIKSEVSTMANNLASPLRFGLLEVSVGDIITLRCYSYVSPVWSRLDDKLRNDFRYISDVNAQQQKITNLNALTSFNDSVYGSFARISKEKTGESEDIPSYNGVLSSFRCYGMLESLLYNVYKAGVNKGFSAEELDNIISVMDQAFYNTEISPIKVIGIGNNITYQNYQDYKWYTSLQSQNLYKWRP